MSGLAISGSLLTSFVIDRNGTRETITPTNVADNDRPTPFSVELHFDSPESADAVAASAAQAANNLRAVQIEAAINEASIASGLPPIAPSAGA